MTADLFDASAMYDDDYLHFFARHPAEEAGRAAAGVTHGPAVPAAGGGPATADVVWRLLGLAPGMTVLDLACGHGSLAAALAARGCRVTGLDFSEVFLARARSDAAARALDIDYVPGDMRELPREWTGRFDRVVNWSTAFGYFDDAVNRHVLDEIVRVLRPGGRLALDLDNQVRFLTSWTPSRITVALGNGDLLADRHRFDPLTGRFEVERTVVRDGRARTLTFVKRLFGFPEIRDWCAAAGCTTVAGHGEDGEPLSAEHRRMVVVAAVRG
ncbi:SAM-dependent methyltransferase [Actinoplanes sp. SE50]|uniref:class I SAM-dependent methyltransferase n=1 Tax=unclassified Actinoplanes TaxID=2626549 RepID=UPI00023ECAD2|nr:MULTISPECIES: class I SAM-dependent methyltransferase [unclassified Actinoplanes]AEV83173.1 Ubiquinone/menaquinone biosynthesis methyltransferase ubiE [Actinoplanes sp. SE50/110]ATO81566.1 SAM-dependent methyltransferase [Actinoplanes sp. SE50]SLL98974.1 SAM-dependent methyltransferase [Actinoplanes sp. SE50/110]